MEQDTPDDAEVLESPEEEAEPELLFTAEEWQEEEKVSRAGLVTQRGWRERGYGMVRKMPIS